jgi:hypothetical protein
LPVDPAEYERYRTRQVASGPFAPVVPPKKDQPVQQSSRSTDAVRGDKPSKQGGGAGLSSIAVNAGFKKDSAFLVATHHFIRRSIGGKNRYVHTMDASCPEAAVRVPCLTCLHFWMATGRWVYSATATPPDECYHRLTEQRTACPHKAYITEAATISGAEALVKANPVASRSYRWGISYAQLRRSFDAIV